MSDSNSKPAEQASAWAKLPEGQLPIIRDLIALLEKPDELAALPADSFFHDPARINQLIEEMIVVHRKAGLDSPLLKFRKQAQRKQLYDNDDPEWEHKLKKALGTVALTTPRSPVAKTLLPILPPLPGLDEKLNNLEALKQNDLTSPTSDSPHILILYALCAAALTTAIMAFLR